MCMGLELSKFSEPALESVALAMALASRLSSSIRAELPHDPSIICASISVKGGQNAYTTTRKSNSDLL